MSDTCLCESLVLLLFCFSLFLLLSKIKSSVITRLTMCPVLYVIWKGNGSFEWKWMGDTVDKC